MQRHDPTSQRAVKQAKQSERDALEQQQRELKALLQVPEFRRWVWRLIGERCKLLESPGSTNGSIQSTNIGRQDVGREVWSEIEQADALAIPTMMRETHEAAVMPTEPPEPAGNGRAKLDHEETQQ